MTGKTGIWQVGLYITISQCRKFEGNLAEASASRSCGGGGGGGGAASAASMQFTALLVLRELGYKFI